MSPNSLKRSRTTEDNVPLYGTRKKIKTSLLGDDEDVDSFDTPHSHFVLCGRGEQTNRWPGNKAFRRVVEANRPEYNSGPRRNKKLIAISIVEAVLRQDPPGLFVRKDPTSGLWVDIGKKEAIKKTSQALREESITKDKNPVEDRNNDDGDKDEDDNESSYSGDDDGEQEDRKPPAQEPSESHNNAYHFAQAPPGSNNDYHFAHQGGFVQGAVSFHSSERGEIDDAETDEDDFDRMIDNLAVLPHDNLAVLPHDADYEPLNLPEPLSDFSRSSSKGSENGPLPTSMVFQTSIDSSIVSDSETEGPIEISKAIFDEDEIIHPTVAV